MYHHAKFPQNRSIHNGDITIFRLFRMSATAILYLRNSQILLAESVQRAEVHQRAKFHHNPSIHCGVIAIFQCFKMAAVRHLGFVRDKFGPPTKGTWWSLLLCKIWLL